MNLIENTCCFIGHRKAENKPYLYEFNTKINEMLLTQREILTV